MSRFLQRREQHLLCVSGCFLGAVESSGHPQEHQFLEGDITVKGKAGPWPQPLTKTLMMSMLEHVYFRAE